MRRRQLAEDELEQVIKLRQGGASWLAIQEATGIPRRSAKRCYEDWERDRSLEELRTVRRDVAIEEFRLHRDMLLRLADDLVDTLYMVPEPHTLATGPEPRRLRTAEEVLKDLWLSRSRAEWQESPGTTPDARSALRTARQNRLLFESLREHTRERVRWSLLDNWKAAWNACSSTLQGLKEESERVVNHLLDQSTAIGAAARAGGVQEAAETIAVSIVEALWLSQTGDRERDGAASFMAAPGSRNAVAVYGKTSISVSLASVDEALSEELAQLCNEAISALRQNATVASITPKLEELGRIASQLEEDLDPLLLRPLILRTRCDLCPA